MRRDGDKYKNINITYTPNSNKRISDDDLQMPDKAKL